MKATDVAQAFLGMFILFGFGYFLFVAIPKLDDNCVKYSYSASDKTFVPQVVKIYPEDSVVSLSGGNYLIKTGDSTISLPVLKTVVSYRKDCK